MAKSIWRRLCAHSSRIAIERTFTSEGISMESKRVMTAMTTSSSMRVKPGCGAEVPTGCFNVLLSLESPRI